MRPMALSRFWQSREFWINLIIAASIVSTGIGMVETVRRIANPTLGFVASFVAAGAAPLLGFLIGVAFLRIVGIFVPIDWKTNRKPRGFTFIELVGVLTIVWMLWVLMFRVVGS